MERYNQAEHDEEVNVVAYILGEVRALSAQLEGDGSVYDAQLLNGLGPDVNNRNHLVAENMVNSPYRKTLERQLLNKKAALEKALQQKRR